MQRFNLSAESDQKLSIYNASCKSIIKMTTTDPIFPNKGQCKRIDVKL